jgi:predicted Zn-ribbon and HTH transcriptional regulator
VYNENMGEIVLNGYLCERCSHKWVPREGGNYPKVCPKCKSPYWDKPRKSEKKKHALSLKDKKKLT